MKHSVDTFCEMFCGWRLANSYKDLERLGSGVLSIDALTGIAKFDGELLPDLSIAGELQAWFLSDLNTHGIPTAAIRSASLVAELTLTVIDGTKRSIHAHHLDNSGKPIACGEFLRLEIHCNGQVETDEVTYHSSLSDREEWPRGWPAA